MSAEQLYTPRMLSAAVELADYPLLSQPDLTGSAHAVPCGSAIIMTLRISDACITDLGMKVRACAVGQASAAVFARHAAGRDAVTIRADADKLRSWLEDGGPMPDWPDLNIVEPASGFPARHGAMLLPWRAAIDAFHAAVPDAIRVG